jgi:hypothetical protein
MLDRQRAEVAAIQIRAEYDDEAHVWVAQSDEIPLVTEAVTFEILCQKLHPLSKTCWARMAMLAPAKTFPSN